ncbi:hypothetical protein LOZ04_005054 [Ophidiomyces ophidiicola]|nr:hypothetical protein LOZ62_006290 [Ophidiomyces ophidiicola]KAI2028649.1 hypothetical protein LOZ47_006859 [Ophidiomyces ophidiicola]KAI2048528.1 hypothetical protein LOZ38_004280 [Ophidiomyces ophidiicola]KAI2063754.1 hypothetical protein LOZ37_006720 [Ophidiomyces ophidiicola]KAI2102124.1 hypothetical protein LOZ34_005592 [Ophidiomyces ophidiicola]
MFAALPSSSPPRACNLATQPFSPLSPQDAERPRSRLSPMSPNNHSHNKQDAAAAPEPPFSPPSSPLSYAQRYTSRIAHPASRVTGRTSRDIRRNAFLNRVKQDRQSARFNAREDRMLWIEYITQKRRFEEEMARSAPRIDNVEDAMVEDERVGTAAGNEDWVEEAALEEYLAQEREYEAFAEEMERQLETDNARSSSNDEDEYYDSIFTALASQCPSEVLDPDEQMDTSHG